MGAFNVATIVEAVIAFTILEGIALIAYRSITGNGVALRDFAINMMSGLCLMLALRSQVREAGVQWVAFFLLAAGAAHGLDMTMRWRRARRSRSMQLEFRKVAP